MNVLKIHMQLDTLNIHVKTRVMFHQLLRPKCIYTECSGKVVM